MYRCEFPGCKYETKTKLLIEKHHIKPRSQNGTNKRNNLIWLCPEHHRCIYVPDMKRGIHSIKHPKSIIIHGWKESTGGRVLVYELIDINVIEYYFIEKE